jgi:prepilin-type N-terminal cleavage/methylation domain-containing protein
MVVHRSCRQRGFTLIELIFVVALIAVLAGVAIPVSTAAVDDLRTAAAARYVAGRIQNNRMEAIRRSRSVALRFEAFGVDYSFAPFCDGNGDGVRSADIRTGVDPSIGSVERLRDTFPTVHFGLFPGLPDVDGARGAATDGVRIGPSRILTLSPEGTATSGTLYLQGSRAQYAVRVLGATGRARVLRYNRGAGAWNTR